MQNSIMDEEKLQKEIKISITCIARRLRLLDVQVIEFIKKTLINK